MTEVLAWTGAALSTMLGLPQAVRVLRTKQVQSLSAATYWLTLANALVWLSWALATGHLATGIPALVNGPAAVLILRRLQDARRIAARACAAAVAMAIPPPSVISAPASAGPRARSSSSTARRSPSSSRT